LGETARKADGWALAFGRGCRGKFGGVDGRRAGRPVTSDGR
jgi:hypothetical protein